MTESNEKALEARLAFWEVVSARRGLSLAPRGRKEEALKRLARAEEAAVRILQELNASD